MREPVPMGKLGLQLVGWSEDLPDVEEIDPVQIPGKPPVHAVRVSCATEKPSARAAVATLIPNQRRMTPPKLRRS